MSDDKQASAPNINMRLSAPMLAAIDRHARQLGLTRTAYILSWLPENYDAADSEL